jgi:RNA polymerase sigma factor for flagellar operon FliA
MRNTTTALQVPSDNQSPRYELIEQHLPLAKAIVARVRLAYGLAIPFDDLYSLGLTGLMRAAERFDPTRGVPFATFAYHRVRGAVIDGLRRDPGVRLDDPLRPAPGYLAAFESATPANDNGNASVRPEVGHREHRWALSDPSAVRLSAPESLDALADEASVHPDDLIERKQLAELLSTAIAALPEPERRIVELHYYDDLSFSEIGARLGICKPWAFRLHNKAIARLREILGELGETALAALGA